jgi:hypothetical protein
MYVDEPSHANPAHVKLRQKGRDFLQNLGIASVGVVEAGRVYKVARPPLFGAKAGYLDLSGTGLKRMSDLDLLVSDQIDQSTLAGAGHAHHDNDDIFVRCWVSRCRAYRISRAVLLQSVRLPKGIMPSFRQRVG